MIIDGGSRGRAAAARQEQLADRLVALFLARGFKDLTLDQIAAELRCSKATLYRMAESREQLIRAIVVRYFRLATLEVDRRLVPAHGARKRIAAYLLAIAEQLKPATEAFMNDVADFPPAREVYERNTRIAARRIADLISDGVSELSARVFASEDAKEGPPRLR